MDLEAHLRRQIAWSRATFGPAERCEGVIDHIRKELYEVERAPDEGDRRSEEWVDVLILAIDGMWRALSKEGVPHEDLPGVICWMLHSKQGRNEQRVWPDWRTADPTKAIEHDRAHD